MLCCFVSQPSGGLGNVGEVVAAASVASVDEAECLGFALRHLLLPRLPMDHRPAMEGLLAVSKPLFCLCAARKSESNPKKAGK
eukprot:1179452-Prorocentrum_minimum.AAC.3